VENDITKLYELLRAKVVHEDSWIHQRINWLLASNAFLFAAYGALLAVSKEQTCEILQARAYLLLLVPLLGSFLSGFVFAGLVGAAKAINLAEGEWEKLVKNEADRDRCPSLHSAGPALYLGRFASWGLCGLLVISWLIVLAIGLYTIGLPK
jgi:hypothetical protein